MYTLSLKEVRLMGDVGKSGGDFHIEKMSLLLCWLNFKDIGVVLSM